MKYILAIIFIGTGFLAMTLHVNKKPTPAPTPVPAPVEQVAEAAPAPKRVATVPVKKTTPAPLPLRAVEVTPTPPPVPAPAPKPTPAPATTTPPPVVSGTINPTPTMPVAYQNKVTVETGSVKGCKYPEVAEQQGFNMANCEGPQGDAQSAYITIAEEYASAIVSYWPADNLALKKTTGGLFNGNKTAMIGTLLPATKYEWEVQIFGTLGQVTKSGSFTTPEYPIDNPS